MRGYAFRNQFQKPLYIFLAFFGFFVIAFLFQMLLPSDSKATDGDLNADPQWWPSGVLITEDSESKILLPSPTGGAVVVWIDAPTGTTTKEVRAQRLDSNGNFLWGTGGVVVSSAEDCRKAVGALDSWTIYGGLILAWETQDKIYAQRLDQNGQKQWGNGVQVFSSWSSSSHKPGPRICGDGVGGAYIGWRNRVVYIDSEGNLPYGGVDGIEIAPSEVKDFSLISDGTGGLSLPGPTLKIGGAYAAWFQVTGATIKAQRIHLGDVWAPGGVYVSDRYTFPAAHLTWRAIPIAKDSSDNLLIAWWGWEEPTLKGQIRAQKLDKWGAPQWDIDGVVVLDSDSVGGSPTIWGSVRTDPSLISDDTGGAFFAWNDYRNDPNGDIYAQRLGSATGTKQWAANGIRILTAGDDEANSSTESFPQMAGDGGGGVVMIYGDYTDTPWDIAATRLDQNGVRIWSKWLPFNCDSDPPQCDGSCSIVQSQGQNGAILACGEWTTYAHKLEISTSPPPNDNCADAKPINNNSTTYHDSLYWATNDGSATCGSSGQPDLWYSFSAPSYGTLRLNTCETSDMFGIDSGVDTVLSVHSACPGTVSNQILCNDDWVTEGYACFRKDLGDVEDSSLTIPLLPKGETVLIRATRSDSSSNGIVRFELTFEPDLDHDQDGYTDGQGDCNDNDNTIYPGAPEICDGKANDCDDLGKPDGTDETWIGVTCDGSDADWCEEGNFICSGGQQLCSDNTGNNIEWCDGADNDCRNTTNDGSGETWFLDQTNCGLGLCASTGQLICQNGSQHNTCAPGTPTETMESSCSDGLDNDCDGQADCDDSDCNQIPPCLVCIDSDEDTFFAQGGECGPSDCNDKDDKVYPGAPEICDGKANDCDELGRPDGTDEPWIGTPTNCGVGECVSTGQLICQNGSQHDTCTPGIPTDEICADGLDNDCNGVIDDGTENTYFIDADGDGYGSGVSMMACFPPQGYVANYDDCDDDDENTYPDALEVCDGKDNNCNNINDIDEEICNTPPGDGPVTVRDEESGISVTFPQVEEGGDTTIAAHDCEKVGEGFQIIPVSERQCVEIETTAIFEETMVCIPYNPEDVPESFTEEDLAILHCDQVNEKLECELIDCESCVNSVCDPQVNLENNEVCACVDHFSVFAIGIPEDMDEDQIPDLRDLCPYLWDPSNHCLGCIGDFDEDNDVDGSDFSAFMNDFVNTTERADFNRNALSESGDVEIFASDYGRTDCWYCIDGDEDDYGDGKDCIDSDCDDTRADIHPGEQEICNGLDDNCNGEIDESGVCCGNGTCEEFESFATCPNDCEPEDGTPCEDGDSCTENDTYQAAVCSGDPISCNDGNLCTEDSCDSQTGCTYTPVTCEDEDICTVDSCDPQTGCVYTPDDCDDGNECTIDLCSDWFGGCINEPVIGCFQARF